MICRTIVGGALAIAGMGVLAAKADTVSISTLPPGALLNIQAQAMAKVIQENTGLQMRVVSYNDDAATMAAANSGAADFVYGTNNGAGDAFTGVHDFEGRAMENLRVVAAMVPIRIGLIVRKDSGIESVGDLAGKRYPVGWQGLPVGISLSRALLSTGGITFDDIEGVSSVNLIRAAEDFKAGRLDSTFFALGAPKMAEIDAAIGMRFLDLPDDDAARKAVVAERPEFSLVEVQPAPSLAGIEGPTTLLQYYVLLMSHKDTSDEVVRAAAKALHENKEALVAGHPTFKGMDPGNMGMVQPRLQYHPAAIAYYKEIGIWSGE